ncbi:TonB-dependent receptor [uncultured Sphingomonas sp.]|uniref:TonB-dependent receptor n=1 Tax=uncultured Sphingomonas sp. TaxID=158754 RepID=UPI002615D325|nr:TonB-dependent receptor [uncultured Sphingomonas sp.]
MTGKTYWALKIGSAAIALTVASVPANAQQIADAQRAAPTENTASPEIIVTATKRAQSVQKVPISMTVIGSEKLAEFQATDMKSIVNSVPNVAIQRANGNDAIYIRGFGSASSNYAFDPSVSLYMDGIYTGKQRQAAAPFFDVERVEVLRGPQGALFGKNTAAGAISVVSANPTKEMSAGLTGTYNFDQKGYLLDGYVSGPVTDTLGVRFALRLQDQDGYVHNLGTGAWDRRDKMQMFRVTAHWEPSNFFDTTLKAEYGNIDRAGGLTVSSPLNVRQDPGYDRYTQSSPLGPEGWTNHSVLLSNTANAHFGEFTLTSVTGYSWFSGRATNVFDQNTPSGTIVPLTIANSYPEKFSQFSQEVRLLSPTGRTIEYVVGAYYDTGKYSLAGTSYYNLPTYQRTIHTNFAQNSDTKSVFGQVTIRPAAIVRVIGSLRYTNTHKDATFFGDIFRSPTNATSSAVGKINEDHVDPSATIQVDLAPDVMAYATYGRGSKSGGFASNTNGTTSATFQFLPEQSENYEAGLKFAALNRAIVGSISTYHTRFKNLQVSVYSPSTSSFLISNAASATAKGFEGSLTVRPIRNFDISANGAYLDIKYDDYPGAACLATQPSTCVAATNNLAGYSPPYSSKWTGSVQAHARFDLADYKIDVTGGGAGRTGFYDADTQDPNYGYQKGYIKYDLRVQFAPTSENWHIALVGRNLSDVHTVASVFVLPASLTPIPRALKFPDAPRSIALEVGVKL